MKKKIWSLLLAAALTASTAGCAGTNGAGTDTPESESAAETETADEADAETAEETAAENADTEDTDRAPDYADATDWLHLPETIEHEVDTFYVYPTVTMGEDIPADVPIDNEMMRQNTQMIYDQQATCYEEATNVFAPYYRQKEMGALTSGDKNDCEKLLHDGVQYEDVKNALDYYFDNYNEGRPFILAAHSQGSIILKSVLKEYMADRPECYERMVAAYAPGFSFTKEDMDAYPHLAFATGASDTGVIISWNTEGADNKDADNTAVLDGALCINPLNWKTDDTYAPVEENIGSRLDMDGDGTFDDQIPGVADAQIDVERGALVTTCTDAEPSFPAIFGPQSYHGNDYDLYYYNVRQNVQERIDAYLSAE